MILSRDIYEPIKIGKHGLAKREQVPSKPSYRVAMVRQTGITSMFNVITLANFLKENDFDVNITCIEPRNEGAPGLQGGIEVAYLGAGKGRGLSKSLCRFRGAVRLRRHLRSRQTDVLYVLDSWTLPTLWFAGFGDLRWHGNEFVYHTNDWLEPGIAPRLYLRLERTACRKADLVVNTDRARARMQRTLYGLAKTPLWVQNSLPASFPVPQPDLRLRQEMSVTLDPSLARIIIYPTVVSNADSAQRMTWELIRCMRFLPEKYCLVLFYRDGSEYQRCASASKEWGIAHRVRFMEPVPFLRLAAYVASADLGAVLYDDAQSSGYFMCNADKLSLLTACGLPYVASDQPNLEAVTYRHALGECCDPRNPEALAQCVRTIGDGDAQLALRKLKVRRAFLEFLSFESHGPKLVDGLRKLIHHREGAG
jgi:glycosyltransferase involved in cell wall biosynthesis